LLQSGSRSMASSSSTSGERSSSLAGFQTYAEGLAAKYLETALPLDSDMRTQITTVINWIDTDIKEHLENGDRIDRQKVLDLSTDLTGCVTSAEAEVETTKTLNNGTITSRQKHLACRQKEVGCVTSTNQACQEYDAYRQTDPMALLTVQAPCALETDFSDEYIQADEDDQSGKLQDMEACLILTKTWHSALYTLYAACKRADCVLTPPSCLGAQHDFEATHCEAKTKQDFVCNSFDTCVEGNEDPCDDIAIDVGARKADYEAGERIKCLLIVLRDAEDNCTGRSDEVPPCKEKPDELRKCTEKTYDTTSYNIACSKPSVSSPPALGCGSPIGAVSCSQAFLDAEYAGSAFEHVKPCDCHKCLAMGGAEAPVCPFDPVEQARCAGDYGQAIGDPVCCGQTGYISSASHTCNEMLPICTDFVQGTRWGSCMAKAAEVNGYVEGTSGSTSCAAGSRALTESECEQAAGYYSKSWRGKIQTDLSRSKRPSGCYLLSSSEVWFNPLSSGVASSSSRILICQATCDTSTWSDVGTSCPGTPCKVRAMKMHNSGKYNGKCADYCKAQGLECLAQQEDSENGGSGPDDCLAEGGWSGSCATAGKQNGKSTNDLLCTCKAPPVQADAEYALK